MRDSSKFAARRKNAGRISNARRGMNPISSQDATRVPSRAASSSIRPYTWSSGVSAKFGEVHRNLRATAARPRYSPMAFTNAKSPGRFADLARDRLRNRRVAPSPGRRYRRSETRARPPSTRPPVGCAAMSPMSGGVPSKPAPPNFFERFRARDSRRGFVKIHGHAEAPPDLLARAMRRCDAVVHGRRPPAARTESRPPRPRADARPDAAQIDQLGGLPRPANRAFDHGFHGPAKVTTLRL